MKSLILTSFASFLLLPCHSNADLDGTVNGQPQERYELRKTDAGVGASLELWKSAGQATSAQRVAELPLHHLDGRNPAEDVEIVQAVAGKSELGVIVRADTGSRFSASMGIVPGGAYEYTFLFLTSDIKATLEGTGCLPMPKSDQAKDPYEVLLSLPLRRVDNPDKFNGRKWPWATQMQDPRNFTLTAEIQGQQIKHSFEYNIISFRMDGVPQPVGVYGQSDFIHFYRPEDARRLVQETLLFDSTRPQTFPKLGGDYLVESLGGFPELESFFRPHVENEEMLQKFLEQVRAIQRYQAEKRAEWAAGEQARSLANAERLEKEEEERRKRVKEMDAKADKLDLELHEQALRERECEQKQREEELAE